MPQIRLENVVKHYDNFLALPALNLHLNNHEFTVLVGPSGCGKSTTLRLLAGLEHLSSGEIYFDDKPISQLPAKSRDLTMVFQDYALYPHMNILKNMSFSLRLQKTPKNIIEQKVKQVADILNIGHLLDRKPSQLSGGQRQRVAMGRALVRDASTFLFDEPLSNLDAKLRARMRTELAQMRDQLDKNMIYVTHDQVEAMTLGQRIVVMNKGEVQQQGSPESLYKYPCNLFVAGFIGSPGMNFLNATWVAKDDGYWLVGEGFSCKWQGDALNIKPDTGVVIGFRPNSATLVDGESPGQATFHATSVVQEYLGAVVIMTTLCQGQTVLLELNAIEALAPRAHITIGVNFSDCYLFDRDSQQSIYPVQDAANSFANES